MKYDTSYTNKLFEHAKNDTTKTGVRVFGWLNRDYLNAVVVDSDRFWVECTLSSVPMPNYVYEYINRYMKTQGKKSLNDMHERIQAHDRAWYKA
jgi:hypothetical protein